MNYQDQNLDEQLADYTDALLAGKTLDVPDPLKAEAETVATLAQLIQPQERDAALRRRLTAQLNEEWQQVQRQKQRHRLRMIRQQQIGFAVAALVLILVGVVLLGNLGASDDPAFGTAQGSADIIIMIVLIGSLLVGGWWGWQRWR